MIQTFNDMYEYLKSIGYVRSLKDFAKISKYNYTYLSELKNGKKPLTIDFVRTINKKFNVDFDFISESKENNFRMVKELPEIKESEPSRKIPIAGDVYATISEAMQDVVAYGPQTFVNIPIFSQGEFALQASGHSMKGYINQGDWIVVKRITNRDAIIYGECSVVVTKGDNLKTAPSVVFQSYKKAIINTNTDF